MFRTTAWIEDRLDAVLVRHEASPGSTTCLWFNVRMSRVLFDRRGWFAQLQERAAVPYPDGLRRAIVAKNRPLLKEALSSYARQIARAGERGDLVSLNHRTAAFLASTFDILFAVNREPHPGEKRLLTHASRLPIAPKDFRQKVEAFLAAAAGTGGAADIAAALADDLDGLLRMEGLIPNPA